MKLRCEHGLPCARELRLGLVVAACALLSGLAGCGPGVSDATPTLDSRAAATSGPEVGVPARGQAAAGGGTDRGGMSPVPNISGTNPDERNSSDANTRFHAQENSEAVEDDELLDPDSERMEGARESPAMQAAPSMTLEQYVVNR